MRGHFVIADISGYTQFLTDSELEHANGIIAELLNAIINRVHAPLTVSSVAGDAVLMYGSMPDDTSGQSIVESVELLYHAFASALETMVINTTCQCNACANISGLGLKIVMHCGEYVITNIGGNETLSGPDVIAVHRLLKNDIVADTGISDYLLVTQPCVEDLGIERIVAGWIEHTETYEHVGELRGYVTSLPEVYEFVRQQNEDKVLQRDAWLALSAHSAAPPAIVWDNLVDPIKRAQWMGATTSMVGEESGRIVPGTEYHCAHGDDNLVILTVMDRRPVDYITFLSPLGNGVTFRLTDYVIASGAGTRIVSYAAKPFMAETGEPLPEDAVAPMAEMFSAAYQTQLDTLAEMADAAAASLSPA